VATSYICNRVRIEFSCNNDLGYIDRYRVDSFGPHLDSHLASDPDVLWEQVSRRAAGPHFRAALGRRVGDNGSFLRVDTENGSAYHLGPPKPAAIVS
jgi:hypothetical protein